MGRENMNGFFNEVEGEGFPPSAGEAPDAEFAEVNPSSLGNGNVTVNGFNTEISTKLLPDYERVIAEMKTRYLPLKILGVNDKIGYLTVQDAKRIVRNTRLDVERRRKEEKEEILKAGRNIDNGAKWLTAELEPIEDRLSAEMSVIDDEKDRIKAEAQRKLDERNNGRLAALMEAGKTSISLGEVVLMTDAVFADYLKMAISEQAMAKQAAIDAETARKAQAEKEAQEAAQKAKEEAKRIADAKAENAKEAARLTALKAEQDKAAAVAKAEQDKAAAALKAEREIFEKQQAEVARLAREEQIRKDAEAKAKADAELAAKTAETEKAMKAAKLKAIEEAKPDAAKLEKFAAEMAELAFPKMVSEAGQEAENVLHAALFVFVEAIRTQAKGLTK